LTVEVPSIGEQDRVARLQHVLESVGTIIREPDVDEGVVDEREAQSEGLFPHDRGLGDGLGDLLDKGCPGPERDRDGERVRREREKGGRRTLGESCSHRPRPVKWSCMSHSHSSACNFGSRGPQPSTPGSPHRLQSIASQRERQRVGKDTDMEILVREEGAHLAHHILHEIFRLLFGDVQGHTVPHRPSELALVVSCQPVVAISDQIGVGLANGGGVSRSVELRDDADTSGVGVRDEVRDGLWRVGSFGMIGRLLLELYRRESEENEDMREADLDTSRRRMGKTRRRRGASGEC
jgi:hypothetical protein